MDQLLPVLMVAGISLEKGIFVMILKSLGGRELWEGGSSCTLNALLLPYAFSSLFSC